MTGFKKSIRPNPAGDRPKIDPTTYVDPTAQVIGNIQVGPGVFIGPNAVLRADELGESGKVEPIIIGPECNVQDGAVIHSLGGEVVAVGERVSMAHGCVVHGPCRIGDGCFIGFRAVVFNAVLGAETFVGAGAIVQGVELAAGTLVPPGILVDSAEVVLGLPRTGAREHEFSEEVAATNMKLAEGYLALQNDEKEGT